MSNVRARIQNVEAVAPNEPSTGFVKLGQYQHDLSGKVVMQAPDGHLALRHTKDSLLTKVCVCLCNGSYTCTSVFALCVAGGEARQVHCPCHERSKTEPGPFDSKANASQASTSKDTESRGDSITGKQ